MTDEKIKLPAVELSNVEISEDGVLYIQIVDPDYKLGGPDRRNEIQKDVRDRFLQMLPDTKIIVGYHDLKFTTITKKQEFGEKLAGNI